MADAKILKPFILSWEGGYVNDPNDLGGHTNKGVTLATFKQVYGKDKTVADLKRMTEEQWLHIFKRFYWDKWKADEIKSQSIANLLVDFVWASGAYGIRIPQKVLGVATDGIVGAKTLAALNSREPKELFETLKRERKDFIERICRTRPANSKFKRGWLRRIDAIGYGWLEANGKRINN